MPRVRIHLRAGERWLGSVAAAPSGSTINPHDFRSAVAHTWRYQQRGVPLSFLGWSEPGDVAIDIGLPEGDDVLPGHIYRFRTHDGRRMYLFLTELSVRAARIAIGDTARGVGLHADPVMELVAVHILCPPEDDGPAQALMLRLLELCVAAEAMAEVASVVA